MIRPPGEYDPPLEEMPGPQRALRVFARDGFGPGSLLTQAWLDTHLGLRRPERATFEEFERFKLRELRVFSTFRELLLEELQLALSSDDGGYRVLTASEQLRKAQEEGRRRVRSALRWQASMLLNTNVDALSDRERAAHVETMAKLAQLKFMTRTAALITDGRGPKDGR